MRSLCFARITCDISGSFKLSYFQVPHAVWCVSTLSGSSIPPKFLLLLEPRGNFLHGTDQEQGEVGRNPQESHSHHCKTICRTDRTKVRPREGVQPPDLWTVLHQLSLEMPKEHFKCESILSVETQPWETYQFNPLDLLIHILSFQLNLAQRHSHTGSMGKGLIDLFSSQEIHSGCFYRLIRYYALCTCDTSQFSMNQNMH